MKDKIHKTSYVLEVSIFNPEENFQTAKDYFKTNNRKQLIKKAESTDCDILSLRFNITDISEISAAKKILENLLPYITKPLMLSGTNNDNIDKELLPAIMEIPGRECIISFANENTYKDITPYVIKNGHKLVLKSPIDINLCRELNILTSDLGLPPAKIIIDTDIGGLGYGLEYGYSIMEKIKLENDEYLNMPLISFVSNESLKTKEAKSDRFSQSWGDLKTRTRMFEIASAAAVKASGADIIVLYNPESIQIMKGLE